MFYKKIDIRSQMKVIYNIKHRYVIRLKFADQFLTSLTKLVPEATAIVCSTIRENLLECQ